MPDKSQSDVAYGFVGIRRSDPGYMAASVMNNALGQYALGGRLGDSIRERQGMAYYVFSSLDAGLGPGAVMVRAGVSADNVDRTMASIDHEIRWCVGEGFTEKEIAESRQYMIGSLPAPARNQRRHRRVPAERGDLRAGARLRPAPARSDPRRDARRRHRGRAAAARSGRATVVVAGPEAEAP